MEIVSYEIKNDGAVGFEREESTVYLVVNLEGEESISFSPQRITLHNCSIRNFDCKGETWNRYFSIVEKPEEKAIIINSNKYQSIMITREKD